MASVNIRPATRDDMPQVYNFIRGQHESEKDSNAVGITMETLILDGFGTNPPLFGCFVADTAQGQIVGYSIYSKCYSTWVGKSFFLRNLYVEEKFRNLGIGRKLFTAVANLALQASQRIDFYVSADSSAVNFFKKLGVENISNTESWQLYQVDKLTLKSLFD